MSGSCMWCNRRRPSVTIEIDGKEMPVCEHCKQVVEMQRELHESEKQIRATERRATPGG